MHEKAGLMTGLVWRKFSYVMGLVSIKCGDIAKGVFVAVYRD